MSLEYNLDQSSVLMSLDTNKLVLKTWNKNGGNQNGEVGFVENKNGIYTEVTKSYLYLPGIGGMAQPLMAALAQLTYPTFPGSLLLKLGVFNTVTCLLCVKLMMCQTADLEIKTWSWKWEGNRKGSGTRCGIITVLAILCKGPGRWRTTALQKSLSREVFCGGEGWKELGQYDEDKEFGNERDSNTTWVCSSASFHFSSELHPLHADWSPKRLYLQQFLSHGPAAYSQITV